MKNMKKVISLGHNFSSNPTMGLLILPNSRNPAIDDAITRIDGKKLDPDLYKAHKLAAQPGVLHADDYFFRGIDGSKPQPRTSFDPEVAMYGIALYSNWHSNPKEIALASFNADNTALEFAVGGVKGSYWPQRFVDWRAALINEVVQLAEDAHIPEVRSVPPYQTVQWGKTDESLDRTREVLEGRGFTLDRMLNRYRREI